MDTLATHPLTKKAEGELAVDVVVYAAGHFPVARHAQQLSQLGIKSLVSGQEICNETSFQLPTILDNQTLFVNLGGLNYLRCENLIVDI